MKEQWLTLFTVEKGILGGVEKLIYKPMVSVFKKIKTMRGMTYSKKEFGRRKLEELQESRNCIIYNLIYKEGYDWKNYS